METNNKLREALTKILNLTNSLDEDCAVDPVEIRDIAKAALAEPVKNCEVGTAEEQEVRFRNYCWNHSSRDKNMECQCPIDAEGKAGCKLTWAQLPYEEGGAK